LTHYGRIPDALKGFSEEFVTHSSKHSVLDHFKGREVAVIGGGASALDLAALLNEAGSHVQVVARKPVIRFHDPPDKVEFSLFDRLRSPVTGIGSGWKLFWCVNAPLLFRQMPQHFRLAKVRRLLGPAACWFTQQSVVGKVPLNTGFNITEAKVQNGRLSLRLTDSKGTQKTLVTDHVIAATGYIVDLRRLTFMESDLQSGVEAVEHTPVLSSNFESSVPGLYFVGSSAANTFGPLLRFAFGARFTARRLSRHLAESAARKPASDRLRANVEVMDRNEVGVR
jgi:thioredoxin reductase